MSSLLSCFTLEIVDKMKFKQLIKKSKNADMDLLKKFNYFNYNIFGEESDQEEESHQDIRHHGSQNKFSSNNNIGGQFLTKSASKSSQDFFFKKEQKETKAQSKQITSGQPVLIKSVLNDMYLGVKTYDKTEVVLANLEDDSCEFIFVLETLHNSKSSSNSEDRTLFQRQNIHFDSYIKIKSLSGGQISVLVQKEYLEFAESSCKRTLVEDKDQIQVIENIDRQIEKPTDLKTDRLENSFGNRKDRQLIFSCVRINSTLKDITLTFKNFTQKLIDFYIYFQDWGHETGKVLRTMNTHIEDFRLVEDSTYYSYEVRIVPTSTKLFYFA